MNIVYRNVCGGWKLSAPEVLGLLALRWGIHQCNRSPIHAWQLVISFTPPIVFFVVAHNQSRPFLHAIIGLHHGFVSYRWRIFLVSSSIQIVPTNITTSFFFQEARPCWLSSPVREIIPLNSSSKPVPAVKTFVPVVPPCQALSYVCIYRYQSTIALAHIWLIDHLLWIRSFVLKYQSVSDHMSQLYRERK